MFLDPKSIINKLNLEKVNTVVDMGTGSGVWALEIATKLAGRGVVYGVDVQDGMLTRLSHSAKEARLSNITPVHANIEKLKGVPLREAIADLIIISNVLYCAEDRKGVIDEASRLAQNGAQLLLVDWTGPHRGVGPEREQVITQEMGESLAQAANFEKSTEISAGEYHWAVLFSKKATSQSRSSFAI